MLLARSIVFTSWMILSMPFYALAVLLAAPLPYRRRYAIAVAWVRNVMGALKLLCGLDFTVERRGELPPGPCVVMLKHSSTMETLVELLLFPHQTWALKRELMFLPFFGWGLALLKPLAVHRGGGRTAVNSLVQNGIERLGEGLWVMIFPEGTRVPSGYVGRYGVGGAALARRAGVPIVPVAHNAGDFWPRRGWLKRRGTVRFVIGPPIPTEGREPRAINNEVRRWIEATVAEIRGSDPAIELPGRQR